MTNPLKLLRDFLKWRKERFREMLEHAVYEIEYQGGEDPLSDFWEGIIYGIEHRKEILKQVKI